MPTAAPNRSIPEQAKGILLVCSTDISQTDGFPSFFSLQCRCHSAACVWAAAGPQLSKPSCNCFQNPVLIRGCCISTGQEILCWLCVFNVAHSGNRECFSGDDPSHKSKLGWGFNQTLQRSKKGKKHRLDKYSKSNYYMKLEILKNTMNPNKRRRR